MSLLYRFFPKQPPTSLAEKFLSGLSAFLGIAILWHFRTLYPPEISNMVIASMGATAVLLFATPHSTLVQPSAILGGHLVSAVVGVAAHHWVPSPFAAAVAVGGAVTLMHLLHCLHPPGGATALFAVTGGSQVWDLGFGYVITPVGISALVLLLSGLIINNIRRPGLPYPAPLPQHSKTSREHVPSPILTATDIRQALEDSGTYIDVMEDDLLSIFQDVELSVARRSLSGYRVGDIELHKVSTLYTNDSLQHVLDVMKVDDVDCVVILNQSGLISGIITRSDLIRQFSNTTPKERKKGIISLLRTRANTRDAEVLAGEIMSSPVITVGVDDTLATVAAVLATGHLHHIPVTSENMQLLGVITHAHLWAVMGRMSKGSPNPIDQKTE